MVEVLIAGDSQTGALFHRVRRHPNVALVAAPGQRVKNIQITPDGQVTGYEVQLNSPAAPALHRFDLAYIYADMAEPLTLMPKRLHRYSAAYLAAHVTERLQDSHSIRLARAMAQVLPPRRIILIPKPIPLSRARAGFAAMTLQDATARVQRHIGFPIAHLTSGICAPDGTPDPAYYENSADWLGEIPKPDAKPDHDNDHLNTRGGDLLFEAFKRDVAARFIPVRGNRHRSSPPAHPTPPPPP